MDAQAWKGPARTTYRLACGLLLAVLFAAVAALGIGRFCFGLRYVPILTGSMSPGMPTGSLAILTPLHAQDIRVGQVIAFRPPAPYTPPGGAAVVHRVESLTTVDGMRVLTTKGDANPVADPWRIRPDAGTYRKAVGHVPYVGGAVTWLRDVGGPGRLPLAGGALLLALGIALFRRSADAENATA